MSTERKISPPEIRRHVPCDVEVEQALLGTILVDNQALGRFGSILTAGDFYDPLHRRIFEVMLERGGMDPLTLHAAMKADPGLMEVGGRNYLAGLAQAAPALPNVRNLAHVLRDLAVRRSLIRIGEEIANTACEAPTKKTAAAQIAEAAATLRELSLAAENPRRPIIATGYKWTEAKLLAPRPWLYGRHLIRRFPSATIALGGTGKSSLSTVEDIAMASGRPLLGIAPACPLRVWSWNLEDPAEEIDRRIAAACLHYGISEAALGNRLFRDSGRDQPCVIAQTDRSGSFICEPVVDEIIAALLQNEIDVLRIDPFVSCHNVAENDNGAIDMVAKKWAFVADRANCAIDLVQHSRKTGGLEITAEDGRGASALVYACRSVRVLNRMTEVEAENAGVENRRLFFRVLNDKINLAAPSDQADWFKLESIDLGNGPPSDHVGVVVPWQWPDAFDGILPGTLFAVQKRITAGQWRENPQAKDWAGNAVAEVLNLDIRDKSVRARCRTLLHSWISGGALVVVPKLDDKRRERPFVEVGQWVAE